MKELKLISIVLKKKRVCCMCEYIVQEITLKESQIIIATYKI